MQMSLRMGLGQSLKVRLSHTFGETIGDIPMYSLHRISNKLYGAQSLSSVGKEMKDMLTSCLVHANAVYKEESGNDWSCLTSNNLVLALERLDRVTRITVNKMRTGQPREMRTVVSNIINRSHEVRKKNLEDIKAWFADNSEELHYDMKGNVPWFVIKNLRERLSLWVVSKINPFAEDIEEAILDIASKNGIECSSAESAWKKMGGKIHT